MQKIHSFELENVKRVKAVAYEPTENGLTIIGGKNGQGKTSILDSIAWALGGKKFEPTAAKREGSVLDPKLKITLSDGTVVTREGKNGALKVLDPKGEKSGQKLLDSFISQFALDLPKFMEANTKEKGKILLSIIGVEKELYKLETEESKLYTHRTAIGRIADQKKKYADELPHYADLPKEPVSASELIQQQQEILKKNAENQSKRERVIEIEAKQNALLEKREELKSRLAEIEEEIALTGSDLADAKKDAIDLHDESVEELEKNLGEIDELNVKIRANIDKEKAEKEAKEYLDQYDDLTNQIEKIRNDRIALLDNAKMPLEGLSVEQGELVYNGAKWDCMAGSEQLKVATAIVRKLNPGCGFVLMDKLEQMDVDTLKEFGEWLEAENLQVIATRVSTGDECSIIIEDGYIKGELPKEETVEKPKNKWGTWKKEG